MNYFFNHIDHIKCSLKNLEQIFLANELDITQLEYISSFKNYKTYKNEINFQ